MDDLLLKAEQRETLLERETRSLRSHIRQLREQVSRPEPTDFANT